jgi:hypothetical protein
MKNSSFIYVYISKLMSIFNNKTITITFGNNAENHIGMQQIGKLSNSGFKNKFEQNNCKCELINLNEYAEVKTDIAGVLIIKNGVNKLL